MRRQIVAVLLAATFALVAAAACAQVRESGGGGQGGGGGKGENAPVRLAVVPKAIGFDFWETVRLGAECAGQKAQGDVNVQWDGVTDERDVNGQVNLLQNFIQQGVDGLVYAATDAKVLADVSQQALDQGVTVVNIDSGTDPQPEQVPVFATDNVAAATKVPDLIADALKEKGKDGGKVAYIPFQPGTATNDQRIEGFKNGMKDHPELELVAEQSGQSSYNISQQVTEDILTANPDLDAIFAANEPGVIGAIEAVPEGSDIVIVGWDAAPTEIKGVRNGEIYALVVQNPFKMGYDGVNAAVRMVRTGAAVQSTDTGATYVTRENIDSPEVQGVLNPSCKNPPV
jgi:ribose transport system substrate-binding protein